MEQKKLKVVVVGGVAGGASAAARIKRLNEQAEVVVFEKGPDASFSNCSLPYYLSGTVEDSEDLVMMTPAGFRKKHDIDVRVRTEVLSIDRAAKTVMVRSEESGEMYSEAYDKLVLSPGANPIVPPPLRSCMGENVFTIRNVRDICAMKEWMDKPGVQDVFVIGGGFIGIEVAENLRLAGKKVRLAELSGQILQPFDEDIVQILHKELDDNGIELLLHTNVQSITADGVVVERAGTQETYPADAVVLAIGVVPETKLAAAAGLELGKSGAIHVNENYQTSDPDIYAVGDAIEIFDPQTHVWRKLALAGPAQFEARAAADHICGTAQQNHGFAGALCLRVFKQNAAAVGLSEAGAARAGIAADSVLIFPGDKVGIMPEWHYMALKLVFEKPTGTILGAQAIGEGDTVGRMNVIGALIRMHATIYDLKNLTLCYSPIYSTAKDPVNQAALVAINVLEGQIRQVHVSQVRGLVARGAYIVDVREPGEYAAGHLNGAHNIPLTQLRERMAEIPKDVPVYLHCRSSQRSYYAICCLRGHGYENVTNISGSFLGISLYEYFQDKTQGREPILTAYNFD